jgi:hypothetical protein
VLDTGVEYDPALLQELTRLTSGEIVEGMQIASFEYQGQTFDLLVSLTPDRGRVYAERVA